jgi:HAD superfamily hydrolase (TIGR01490 family)
MSLDPPHAGQLPGELMDKPRQPMIVAVFDLDGTLYTGHIVLGIARHHRIHHVKRAALYFYMATHMALWPLWRLGLLPEAVLRELSARHLGWTVRGWTPQEASVAFKWVVGHYVLPLARPEVVRRVGAHQAAGHRVILVSGTLAPLLSEIGRQLGIEEAVGTPLMVREGRYTGASELPTCQGLGKVSRLKSYLADDSIAWSESYVYADSYGDLPLLEEVGHPVAVHPDDALAAHAQDRHWEIIR